jgi:hypothetical protein
MLTLEVGKKLGAGNFAKVIQVANTWRKQQGCQASTGTWNP